MKDLISIIVPIYNVELYLSECIESIINQTYENIEIILVNDGSTDQCGMICDAYAEKDERIQVIHKENKGLSAARNTGLKLMHGDYVMFVDGDDWIDSETCAVALERMVAYDVDIVLWSYVREYPGNSMPKHIYSEDILFKENYFDLFTRLIGPIGEHLAHPEQLDSLSSSCNKLFKVNGVAENVCFVDTKIIGTEDLLYNIEVFKKANSAFYHNACFYHYRRNLENSLTRRYKKDLIKTRKRLFSKIEEIIRDEDINVLYEAFSNRIALDIIGQGLNICNAKISLKAALKLEKKLLNEEIYSRSLKRLNLKNMPIQWKIYFWFAKINCYGGCLLLNKTIDFLRSKI